MINFKREYIGLEQDRLLYPVSFKDKAKCNVYGRKKFITEAGEVQLSAHVFLISKDFWTFNAGQLDFTNYPNGIWNDYISIDIIEKDEYTAPSINFGSMGDITPENLQGLSDYISKHLSDLEKRIVEDYLFIDEGVSENIGLPNLPENHFWVRKNGVIVGVNLDYLKTDYEHLKNELWKNYESFNEKLQAALKKYYDDLELQMNNFFKDLIEKIREEAEKQLGLIAGAGGGLLHKIDQANHGFIFDPIVYENGVWKKATTTSGVDGIGVVISANTFFFLEAGEIEIPKGATDKDGQPLLDDEYYYMNEDGGTGFQKEEPVWFYQPLFHTRTHKGKLLANVSIDTMEDLRGQVVDTESGRTHGIALWGDIVPKFDTIEKLQKAFWLKEGEVVEVLGYYSAGDGAEHKRIIKAEDDGSGVQLSNKLWACIVHNGEVNVSWFGAKGDGVSDNTEAIQKAIDYTNNIYVSKGTFLVSEIKLDANKIFKGNNQRGNAVLKQLDNHDSSLISLKNQPSLRTQNVRLEGFSLQPNKLSTKPVVNFDGASYSLIRDIECVSAKTDGANWDLRNRDFISLQITDTFNGYNEFWKIHGIGLKNGINGSSNGLTVNNFLLNAMAVSGIRFSGAEFTANNGECSGEVDSGIYIENCSGINITGVWFEKNSSDINELYTKRDIVYGNNCTEISVKSCRFDRNDYVNAKTFQDWNDYSRGIGANTTVTTTGLVNGNFLLFDENNVPIGFEKLGDFTIEKLDYSENLGSNGIKISNFATFDRIRQPVLRTPQIKSYVGKKIHVSGVVYVPNNELNYKQNIKINLSGNVNSGGAGYYITNSQKGKKIYFTNSLDILSTHDIIWLNVINESSDETPLEFELANLSVSIGEYSFAEHNKPITELGGKIWSDIYIGGKKFSFSKTVPASTPTKYSVGDIIYNTGTDTNILGWICTYEGSYNAFKEIPIVQSGAAAQLNTLYHGEKMKQENVYDDYISYMDEKTSYDKQQRKLEQDRQLAYEEALKENPELTFEEFISVQPMTLNLVEEPQPSENLKKFMDKYL